MICSVPCHEGQSWDLNPKHLGCEKVLGGWKEDFAEFTISPNTL